MICRAIARPRIMHVFELHRQMLLDSPVREVFPFFAAAENLEALTPPWLRFRILSPLPIRMAVGALIDYRLVVHGLPLRWRSEITAWEPPHRFVDEQRRGPYRRWVHEHRFEPRGERTLVTDHVRYSVWGGRWVQRLFVARDLEQVFGFRSKRLAALFGGVEAASTSTLAAPGPPESGAADGGRRGAPR